MRDPSTGEHRKGNLKPPVFYQIFWKWIKEGEPSYSMLSFLEEGKKGRALITIRRNKR